MSHLRNGGRVVAFALAASLLPATAYAQQRPYIGIGYVADAPELFAGGAVFGVAPGLLGGLGLYIDAKFDVDRPTESVAFEPDLTVEFVESEFGDEFIQADDVWYNFDVALMRPLTEEVTAYLGVGYASLRRYSQYIYDDTDPAADERGFGGVYWVEDVEAATTVLNVLGGVFVHLSDYVSAQFGLERQPGGGTVGVSFRLPL